MGTVCWNSVDDLADIVKVKVRRPRENAETLRIDLLIFDGGVVFCDTRQKLHKYVQRRLFYRGEVLRIFYEYFLFIT